MTQTTITGLTNGQTYTIHIHAYDANGNTTRSPSVTSVVPFDTDGDGWADFVEVLLGTEPDDGGVRPRVNSSCSRKAVPLMRKA